MCRRIIPCLLAGAVFCSLLQDQLSADVPIAAVDGQPLAANVNRLTQAMEFLGSPLPQSLRMQLEEATKNRDAAAIQKLLDPLVLFVVQINPESRVKVARGPGGALLQQAAYTPVLVKVLNESTVTKRLRIVSPQAGPVYGGVAPLSMQRQQQTELLENQNVSTAANRFLQIEDFGSPPMTPNLSGLDVEYRIALVYSSEAGLREASVGFDVEQGNQDLGFRGEVPVLFEVLPAIPVRLRIHDDDGTPTAARLVFQDAAGRVYPPQPKRLAPDFFFQKQIYRFDGDTVLLPPGQFTMQYSRGPEYHSLTKEIEIQEDEDQTVEIQLQRWIDPVEYGFYSGDHHIHAAGCSHYQSPTLGVSPADMFRQVKGEGLNVGCVLTWGPCYDYQRQFFSPQVDDVSEPLTLIKYDLEISGFGSQALGHVCLLNLGDQTYPGSNGTSTQGWPTWTTPALRWAKEQGAVTGYAHSASGLQIDAKAASNRLLVEFDTSDDGQLSVDEAKQALLPHAFSAIDTDRNRQLSQFELEQGIDQSADELPNLAIPEMNGVGAQEICVSTALGACDFISAMDTARIQEWNCWYHIMNCGFPLKVSGETDFPCMSSTRVGKGRVYVQLGTTEQISFDAWCAGIAAGRSYVSDGYAHALKFVVDQNEPGDVVSLEAPGTVTVTATVAFAEETPLGVAHGTQQPAAGRRVIGDTVLFNAPKPSGVVEGGTRVVEIVVNGHAVASLEVPADGQRHNLKFDVDIERSSWVALRHFPQMHTNPVIVEVAGKPIRASRKSALWCIATIEQLWRARQNRIKTSERDAARAAFDEAIEIYRQIAAESPADS